MKPTKAAFYYHNLKSKFLLFLRNPRFILFYWGRFRKYSGLDSFDTFIISYPKSGRTWLQRMIIEAVKLNENKVLDLEDVSELHTHFSNFPTMLSTHASSSWEEIVHDETSIMKDDYQSYSHGKSIFLYRDPRDVLVSQYYHITLRSGFTSLKKEDMLLNENIGIRKIIAFMNKWKKYAIAHPSDILCISYEALKENPAKGLSDILNFLNIELKEEIIEKAIANTTLKKMKEKEIKGSDSNTPWSNTKTSQANAFQSRKGIVGEYKEFFTKHEIELINQIISEELIPSFNY